MCCACFAHPWEGLGQEPNLLCNIDNVKVTVLKYPQGMLSNEERERNEVSYRKGEIRLSEILKHLAASSEGGTGKIGKWPETNATLHAQSPGLTAAESGESLAKAGMESTFRQNDPLLEDAIAKVVLYLQVQRDIYHPAGRPLEEPAKHPLKGFFSAALLDRVRVLELTGRRVSNPWFYDEARAKGVQNLPDVSHKVAVTFLDVVVFNQKITQRDLFHGLVHSVQFSLLGLERFTELFVAGFLQARSYFLIPLKAHAFALDTRYAENPQTPFSVEEEVRRWHAEGRYQAKDRRLPAAEDLG